MKSTLPEVLVLDSWPVLEWLKGRQPATGMFRLLLDAAVAGTTQVSMSRINQGEVLYFIRKDFLAARIAAARAAFFQLPIKLLSVDDALVDAAVELKGIYPFSYADAFAAALAMRLNAPLVTGDKEFLRVHEPGLQLYWPGL